MEERADEYGGHKHHRVQSPKSKGWGPSLKYTVDLHEKFKITKLPSQCGQRISPLEMKNEESHHLFKKYQRKFKQEKNLKIQPRTKQVEA